MNLLITCVFYNQKPTKIINLYILSMNAFHELVILNNLLSFKLPHFSDVYQSKIVGRPLKKSISAKVVLEQ